eukprot:1186352-Prorocentrum_minimum.AAC.1
MPRAFYDDWVAVALEETTHFGLLTARLHALGSFYGDSTPRGGQSTPCARESTPCGSVNHACKSPNLM